MKIVALIGNFKIRKKINTHITKLQVITLVYKYKFIQFICMHTFINSITHYILNYYKYSLS